MLKNQSFRKQTGEVSLSFASTVFHFVHFARNRLEWCDPQLSTWCLMMFVSCLSYDMSFKFISCPSCFRWTLITYVYFLISFFWIQLNGLKPPAMVGTDTRYLSDPCGPSIHRSLCRLMAIHKVHRHPIESLELKSPLHLTKVVVMLREPRTFKTLRKMLRNDSEAQDWTRYLEMRAKVEELQSCASE